MWNSFFGLEMGRRAMDYFRRGMETAGHNISNADVEGYSSQRVEASTTSPFTNPALNRPNIPGQVGTGVQIDAIVRLRDAFLDIQYREEMTVKGYWEQIQNALSTVEVYVNEPAGAGLKTALTPTGRAFRNSARDRRLRRPGGHGGEDQEPHRLPRHSSGIMTNTAPPSTGT